MNAQKGEALLRDFHAGNPGCIGDISCMGGTGFGIRGCKSGLYGTSTCALLSARFREFGDRRSFILLRDGLQRRKCAML